MSTEAAAPPTARIVSFAAFWPYYMGEHRDPRCRVVHFVGTSGFLLTVLACLVDAPLRFGGALVAMALFGLLAARMEAHRSAAPALLAMILVAAVGNPAVLGGVVFAYACAWAGHFLIEHNHPATFTYPLWSLAGDFRMFGRMLRGRGWSGDGSSLIEA